MTDVPPFDQPNALDIREKIAHIDQMLADHQRIDTDMRRIDANHDRKRQEIGYAPRVLIVPAIIGALTAGAALFAAGAAFTKIFGSP
jgi:hypothetical protein